jgi:hypothetical protein
LKKVRLFIESLKLVWVSTPLWATVNVFVSVVRSILPLVLVFLIKSLIDEITGMTGNGSGHTFMPVMNLIIAVVAIFFLDEI